MNKNTNQSYSPNGFLKIFKTFSPEKQAEIAETINKTIFESQWELLDKALPNAEISDEEIMQEVRAVRYGHKNA